MQYTLLKDLTPSVIYENIDDRSDPDVVVKGVGRYRLSQVEKNVRDKLHDLAERAGQADTSSDWQQVQWMIDHDAMKEMIRTIVSARQELNESNMIEINGYTLRHEEDVEEDNVKIWHFAKAPGESSETTLHHTPYEHLSQDDFAKYVAYHKKHGKWPGSHPKRTNWNRESLGQLIDMKEGNVFGFGKRKDTKSEQLQQQVRRLNSFIQTRESELAKAKKEIERLTQLLSGPEADGDYDPFDSSRPGLLRRQAD